MAQPTDAANTDSPPNRQTLHPVVSNYKKNNPCNLILGHLNVNGLRNKFCDFYDILSDKSIDVLGLCETKIDPSFPDAQFHVDDYRLYRRDRNSHGGGILFYVLASIPHRLRHDLEHQGAASRGIEHLVLELRLKKEKMFVILVYRPPRVSVDALTETLHQVIDRCLIECKTLFIMGDVNVDCLGDKHALSDFFHVFDLVNVIRGPTCFKSVLNPSLIDVILTNSPNRILSQLNVNIDVSDFHNLVCVATRMHATRSQCRTITYRSYRRMNDSAFSADLSCAPFHVSAIFDDVDDQVGFYNSLLSDVIDKHAPLKQKKLKCAQLPYMNGSLRKAINVKAMLKRKYNRCRSRANWERYRRQRNLVTSLKRRSLNTYFQERCDDVRSDSRSFWNAVCPFFSNKKVRHSEISLNVGDEVITDQTDVCNIFNDFFVNVASDNVKCETVNDAIAMFQSHPSVLSIAGSRNSDLNFDFHPVDKTQVAKKLKSLKANKATGHDQIPAALLKQNADVLSVSLTPILNECLSMSVYPDDYKYAEVRPVHKKNDVMDMGNYRPVSILTSQSKILESLMCDQMNDYLNQLLSPVLSAYRKKYSCANVLLKCTEEWRKAL